MTDDDLAQTTFRAGEEALRYLARAVGREVDPADPEVFGGEAMAWRP